MQPSQNRINLTAILLVLVLVILGLQIWQILMRPKASLSNVQSAVPLASVTPVEIFNSQTASIRGKITQINGTKLIAQNDKQVSGDFDAGRVVLINDGSNLSVASSSADLKKIQLNKDAVINLLFSEGRYVVTSITYR